MLNWIINNKELIKIFYSLIVVLICFIIVFKTNRLYKISLHKGIRYFRNAFFFYGIAFTIRYFLGNPFFINLGLKIPLINPLFEFFLVMAGFFLLYSLLWKKIEVPAATYTSSLFNLNILVFYLMSFVIAVMDFLWENYYSLFISQIFLFIILSSISYSNYLKKGKNRKFLKFYFVAMILSLIAWILNAITALLLLWDQTIVTTIYLLNSIIFLLFLYGVVKFTKI